MRKLIKILIKFHACNRDATAAGDPLSNLNKANNSQPSQRTWNIPAGSANRSLWGGKGGARAKAVSAVLGKLS